MTSLPCVSLILGWASPLLDLNNDYWYYLYHSTNLAGYPTTEAFFQIIAQINNAKSLLFSNEHIDSLQKLVIDTINTTFKVKIGYTSNLIMDIDQSSSYFILNSYSVISWSLLTTLLSIIGVKILKYFCKLIKRIFVKKSVEPIDEDTSIKFKASHHPLKYIIRFCRRNSSLSFAIVSIIESNCVFICFYAGVQIRLSFSFFILDKINYLILLTFFYISIIISVAFYLILWIFRVKRTKKFTE